MVQSDDLNYDPRYIEAEKALADTPAKKQFAKLIDYLGSEDARKHDIAGRVLIGIGAKISGPLALEVCRPKMLSEHRLRILNVIDAIHAPLSVSDFMSWTIFISTSKSPAVRERMAQLLADLRAA